MSIILPRSNWTSTVGGGSTVSKPRTGVVVHHPYPHDIRCGETRERERAELRRIDEGHAAKWNGRGGYHLLVFDSGRVYWMRGKDRTGAHSPGRNTSHFGLAFVVNGMNRSPSPAAVEAAQLVLAELVTEGLLVPDYEVSGHGDHQSTSCPGPFVRAVLDQIRPQGGLSPSPMARPIVRLGDRNDHVRDLQTLLKMSQNHRTGYFGPITLDTVKAFQRKVGITVDGIVGSQTWSRLE